MSSPLRIGQGWDLHRLVADRPLILGGVTIEYEKGLAGHSDADVLTHAVIDALLGAVAQDDIGTHFSDADTRWRDARSIELLEEIVRRFLGTEWRVVNVDATVVAEAPRLGPYRSQMRALLATALRVDPAVVSVKAKTAEGLGPEGAGEAISAQAIVLLVGKAE
ncbi:MAG: 2-C-methyl-D-erythritol 2,4-cyclodiphosphate synthase [Candidatus Eisenbacteria bacterium]|nr:2-C-methyl-D-erythritol 2,4-cyclodiphosphate synthase [Candidatus Eisenbacteria bacterium]